MTVKPSLVQSSLLLSLAFLSGQAHAQTLPLVPLFKPAKNLQIRVQHLGANTVYRLDATGHNQAEMLEAIALAGDFHVIVDPTLKRNRVDQLSEVASSLPELLFKVACGLGKNEFVKTASGTYIVIDNSGKAQSPAIVPHEDTAAPKPVPRPDLGLPRFNANGSKTKKIEPQPHWDKFHFNGEDVYSIPLPVPPGAKSPKG